MVTVEDRYNNIVDDDYLEPLNSDTCDCDNHHHENQEEEQPTEPSDDDNDDNIPNKPLEPPTDTGGNVQKDDDHPIVTPPRPFANLIKFDTDGEDENIATTIQTRPIIFNSDNLKAHYRVVLRGLFEAKEGKISGLYVMGSIDGKQWMYIGGTEIHHTGLPIRDIGTTVLRNSMKMMMIVFVGTLKRASKIDNFEISLIEKYNDKIR